MVDLTTPTALAASGLSYTSLAVVGVPDVLAMPLAIAAAGGASWALSNRERVAKWGIREVLSVLSVWLFSWMLGMFFGHMTGVLLHHWLIPEKLKEVIPQGSLSVGCALIISGWGISHILPWAMSQLPKREDRAKGGQ